MNTDDQPSVLLVGLGAVGRAAILPPHGDPRGSPCGVPILLFYSAKLRFVV